MFATYDCKLVPILNCVLDAVTLVFDIRPDDPGPIRAVTFVVVGVKVHDTKSLLCTTVVDATVTPLIA